MSFLRRLYTSLYHVLQLLTCCLYPYLLNSYRGWKSESLCRSVIETLTGEEFSSSRPSWLKNPLTGRNMELDCYNERLGLALEYNGIQHYEYTPYFHKGERVFELQVFRDQIKKIKCRERGVYLLIVPYTIPIENIPLYIYSKLYLVQKIQQRNRCLNQK